MDRLSLITGGVGGKRVARFWSKVRADGECWEWQAATGSGGYGVFKLARGAVTTAHRLALVIFTGEHPADKQAAHLCHNVLCCRPSHLEWQSNADNQAAKRATLPHPGAPT
jgi:hypothetical protein